MSRPRSSHAAPTLLLLCLGASCVAPVVDESEVSLTPATLEFGRVAEGTSRTLEGSVGLVGNTVFQLDGVELRAPAPFTVVEGPGALRAGSPSVFGVRLDAAPPDRGALVESLLVLRNGARLGSLTLSASIIAPGVVASAPSLDPTTTSRVDRPSTTTIPLQNTTDGEVCVVRDDPPSGLVSVVAVTEPVCLAARATVEVGVGWSCRAAGEGRVGIGWRPRGCSECVLTEVSWPVRCAAAPSVAVAPVLLDFGFISPGRSASRRVTISNPSIEPVDVTWVVEAPDAGVFTALTESARVGPDEAEVELRFAPVERRSHRASLRVRSAGLPDRLVSLLGEGGGPELHVAPEVLAFGDVPDGGAATRVVTVSNTGDLPMRIVSVDAGNGFFAVPSGLPGPVAAGGSVDLTVTFSPTSGGDATGALAVTVDDADEPSASVALTGRGVSTAGCAWTQTPPSGLDFGALVLSDATLDLAFTNTGTAPCQLTRVVTTGFQASAFLLSNLGEWPRFVPVGGSFVVGVTVRGGRDRAADAVLEVESFGAETLVTPLHVDPVEPCFTVLPNPVVLPVRNASCGPVSRSAFIGVSCRLPTPVVSVALEASVDAALRVTRTEPTFRQGGLSIPLLVEIEGNSAVPGTHHGLLVLTLEDGTRVTVPVAAPVAEPSRVTDTFAGGARQLDVLFVLDTSGSFVREVTPGAPQLAAFARALFQLPGDVRFAVAPFNGAPLGRLSTRGTRTIFSREDTSADTFLLDVPSTNNGADRNALDVAAAATSAGHVDERGAPFPRVDARYAIVLLTDELDASRLGATQASVSVRAARTGPGDTWVGGALNSFANDPAAAFVSAFSGRVVSLAGTNWEQRASTLVEAMSSVRRTFALSRPALASSVEVRISGDVVSDGFSFDGRQNAVVFTTLGAPDPSEAVTIGYESACSAP